MIKLEKQIRSSNSKKQIQVLLNDVS